MPKHSPHDKHCFRFVDRLSDSSEPATLLLVRDVTKERCANDKEFACVDGIEGRNKANVCLGDTGSPLVSESNGNPTWSV